MYLWSSMRHLLKIMPHFLFGRVEFYPAQAVIPLDSGYMHSTFSTDRSVLTLELESHEKTSVQEKTWRGLRVQRIKTLLQTWHKNISLFLSQVFGLCCWRISCSRVRRWSFERRHVVWQEFLSEKLEKMMGYKSSNIHGIGSVHTFTDLASGSGIDTSGL